MWGAGKQQADRVLCVPLTPLVGAGEGGAWRHLAPGVGLFQKMFEQKCMPMLKGVLGPERCKKIEDAMDKVMTLLAGGELRGRASRGR